MADNNNTSHTRTLADYGGGLMVFQYIAAYAILIGFFLIERFLRKGSKDMRKTKFDKGSTVFISAVMGIAFVLLFVSPILNYFDIAKIAYFRVGIIGLLLGCIGILVRCMAFYTLGRFFTRTLQEAENHALVTNGIYKYIRHPGYLSDILIFLGVGMALLNWIPVIFVVATYPIVYSYRIKMEEKMLIEVFTDSYIEYQKTSKKLIPFIY